MTKCFLSSLFLLLITTGVQAQTPSFDYIDFGYVRFENLLVDANGFELKVSKQVSKSVYLTGNYFDVSTENYSSKSTSIGLGYKFNLSNFTSLFAELNYLNTKLEASDILSNNNIESYEVDSSSFGTVFGVRHNLSEKTEILFAVNRVDSQDSSTNLIFAGNYDFNDDFKVYSNFEFRSGYRKFSLGIRYNL